MLCQSMSVKFLGNQAKRSSFKDMLELVKNKQNQVLEQNWSKINTLVSFGYISYVDYAIADMLLRSYPDSEECVALFICHLSIAARNGHLCIKIAEDTVFPAPKLCWQQEQNRSDASNLSDMEWEEVTSSIVTGSKLLPRELLTVVAEDRDVRTPICQLGDLYYLQRYWVDETLAIDHFQRLMKTLPALVFDRKRIFNHLEGLIENKKLLKEQAGAILAASDSCLTIISGGPGTGKTYTAGQLIRVFWEAMDGEQRNNYEIVLAAPTGKAAANLQKSLGRSVADLVDFPDIKAKTLHALLGINKSVRSPDAIAEPLNADLILVDESSMIDASLMSKLLSLVKPGARLVLLGDPYQLPPVSVGMLFSDFIRYLAESEYRIQATALCKCLRTDLQPIVDFAERVKNGDGKGALTLFKDNSVINRILLKPPKDKLKEVQKAIVEYASSYLSQLHGGTGEDLLNAFTQFCLLSPMRQGYFGVEELNRLLLQGLVQKVQRESWFTAPIMVVNNDPRMELANGDVGVLIRRMSGDLSRNALQEGDYALFPSRQLEEKVLKVPALLLPRFEYAYCISVHKSQGSEWDHVVLLMPEGSEAFGREVFYTAVTRSRKKLEVWGEDETLLDTIALRSQRLSGVHSRLISHMSCTLSPFLKKK